WFGGRSRLGRSRLGRGCIGSSGLGGRSSLLLSRFSGFLDLRWSRGFLLFLLLLFLSGLAWVAKKSGDLAKAMFVLALGFTFFALLLLLATKERGSSLFFSFRWAGSGSGLSRGSISGRSLSGRGLGLVTFWRSSSRSLFLGLRGRGFGRRRL